MPVNEFISKVSNHFSYSPIVINVHLENNFSSEHPNLRKFGVLLDKYRVFNVIQFYNYYDPDHVSSRALFVGLIL